MAMLVAIRTFTTDYDGKRVAITAGFSHIDEQHEIVRRNPSCFRRAPERRRGAGVGPDGQLWHAHRRPGEPG
jgi:hypothetical protein